MGSGRNRDSFVVGSENSKRRAQGLYRTATLTPAGSLRLLALPEEADRWRKKKMQSVLTFSVSDCLNFVLSSHLRILRSPDDQIVVERTEQVISNIH